MSNWTGTLRRKFFTSLPAENLLPEEQPSYVKSSLYLLGALTIASFTIIIVSGIILAIFGPEWWHTSAVGRFFNSVHFWSVQGFFLFMALHLWTTFFTGAWREGRTRTWMTGVIAFVVSIVAAFTGYVSQTNFDSQWIAVSAKDLMNSIGIGGFFNPLNFGQMYSFHVIILPVVVAAIIVTHILLIRMHGVVRPYPARGEQREPYQKHTAQAQYYRGMRMAPYDLIRELVVVVCAVLVLVLVFSGLFGSADEQPLTLQGVAQSDPVGFVNVSLSELAGSSDIANYGPPYNNGTDGVQYLGPVSLQKLGGVRLPLDTAQVYVLGPLGTIDRADVKSAITTFNAASAQQQSTWESNYSDALAKNTDESLDANGGVVVSDGDYGPLPIMFNSLLGIARSGALDGILLTSGQFYQTDFSKPLLFLNESALPDRAEAEHLQGDQWGMMNETGAYPGQAWLWLYTLWYQIPVQPFNGPNADTAVAAVMLILTLALLLVPVIPGLRDLPRYLKVYRIIWRDHYREMEQPARKSPERQPMPSAKAPPPATLEPVAQ